MLGRGVGGCGRQFFFNSGLQKTVSFFFFVIKFYDMEALFMKQRARID